MTALQRYQPCCCWKASDKGELYDVEDVDAEIARLKAQLDDAEATLRAVRKEWRAEIAEYQRKLASLDGRLRGEYEAHRQHDAASLETARMLIETFDDAQESNGDVPGYYALQDLIDQIRAAVEIPSVEAQDADQNSEE